MDIETTTIEKIIRKPNRPCIFLVVDNCNNLKDYHRGYSHIETNHNNLKDRSEDSSLVMDIETTTIEKIIRKPNRPCIFLVVDNCNNLKDYHRGYSHIETNHNNLKDSSEDSFLVMDIETTTIEKIIRKPNRPCIFLVVDN